ncbi:MAG: DsbA family protein [Candidatus Lambdaproteobacteria bacterium]|nr:DsbA family protein [Candidatus Lambdaproteobacteria bacterium]
MAATIMWAAIAFGIAMHPLPALAQQVPPAVTAPPAGALPPGQPAPETPVPAEATAPTGPTTEELQQQIGHLQEETLDLRSRIAAMQARLDAVLGAEPEATVYEIPIGNSPVRGPTEAIATLVEFGDYQSDYSMRAQAVVARLLTDFPTQLKVVYKHYPLTTLHPLANEAALTALAAGKQGLFWEMHDLLYRNTRQLSSSLMLALARQAGLNLQQYESDRNSLWALERLADDEKAGARAAVKGVPAFFLNGRPLPTWRYDYMKAEIQQVVANPPAAPK